MRQSIPATIAGRKSQAAGYAFETSEYDQFQVLCVLGGELHCLMHGHESVLGRGGVAVLRLGSAFRLFCTDRGYQGVFFLRRPPMSDAFRGPAETWQAGPEAVTLAALMDRHSRRPGPQTRQVLVGLGQALTCEALQQCRVAARDATSAAQWADLARQAIDAALYSTSGVREVLAHLPRSYRQLSRDVAARYGLSPKAYQLRARLDEAKRLLRTTHMSVTQVAMELGFSSSQHFATRFGAAETMTPSAWRNAHR